MRRIAFAGVALVAVAVLVFFALSKRAERDRPEEQNANQPPQPRVRAERKVKGAAHTAPLPTGTSEVVELDSDGRVSRRTHTGQVKWSVPLDGNTGGVRPPHLLADAERVYLTHADGVTALDVSNGAVLWRSPGPAERLLLSGDLLAAAECGISESVTKNGRWAVARNVATGRVAFRASLPTADFDPLPIEDAAGLFLLQRADQANGDGLALLLDRTGAEHRRFDREVIAARAWAGGRLILTGRDVCRLSVTGKIEWTVPFPRYEWLARGEFVPLPGGGMVAFVNCAISDSGVQVLRFDPVRGGQVWTASCRGLGVEHSGYNHTAHAERGGSFLRVTSRGSSGTFEECLELATGRSVARETRP